MEEIIKSQSTLKVRNFTLSLEIPVAMGILNMTPDSFSDGGKYHSVEQAVDTIGKMINEGATIIDIGGESTRPGSEPVSESVEAARVLPVLESALKNFSDTLFSVDTTKYRIAEESLQLGAHIVNDISGLRKEPRFAELCSRYNAGYILMHSQGDPKTMQEKPRYKNVVNEIFNFFVKQIEQLKKAGVSSLIIDPGIGFGKTVEHNLDLLKGLQKFVTLSCPVLTGASRKSMIGRLLNERPASGRLAGTLAVHYHCMMQGAKILRVHDVKEAVDTIKIFEALNKSTE